VADPVTWEVTQVSDEELVYRRVPNDRFRTTPDGVLEFSARIFRNRLCRPSVYREALISAPQQAQTDPSDGVLTLSVRAIRTSSTIEQRDSKGAVVRLHAIDVEHCPLGDESTFEYAHAEIVLTPTTEQRSTCNRMYEALALLAKDTGIWAIQPESQRS
jgi:hypothetical protein